MMERSSASPDQRWMHPFEHSSLWLPKSARLFSFSRKSSSSARHSHLVHRSHPRPSRSPPLHLLHSATPGRLVDRTYLKETHVQLNFADRDEGISGHQKGEGSQARRNRSSSIMPSWREEIPTLTTLHAGAPAHRLPMRMYRLSTLIWKSLHRRHQQDLVRHGDGSHVRQCFPASVKRSSRTGRRKRR